MEPQMNADERGLNRVVLRALVFITLASGCATTHSSIPSAAVRPAVSFGSDWRFALGDPKDAAAQRFDDSSWRKVDVPHDWSIEGPFDRDAPAGGAGAFLPTGVGWYRKTFFTPRTDPDQRIFVEFDGVMANSDVYINGHLLGHRPYGYIGFRYEITSYVGIGENTPPLVLAVRCDNSKQPASRWYAGCGIYRHVRLILCNPVHFDDHATFISTPQVSEAAATVHVQTTVVNQSDKPQTIKLSAAMTPAVSGESTETAISPGASAKLELDLKLPRPRRWDIDHPDLYTARVAITSSGKTLDEEQIPFGVREARFDADTGFWLNGRNFKLKGVCLHADAGAWGAAVPLGAWERRLKTLKRLGVNAIRTAHNPPAPEFLDLCDRLGLLVMDENFDCWTVGKNKYDYHLYFKEWSKIDTRDMVRRDRNHPCIVIWSTGNEIHDTPKPDIAKPILAGLVEGFHENDPTRPVTQALFRPNVSHDYDNGLADLLDVVGQNYRENEILAAHEQKPTRKIVGTENGHDRRVWLALRDNKPYAGQFLWSGIDYLGEAYRWPMTTAGAGLLDRTGAIKAMGRERQSWWSEKPVVFIGRRIAPPTSTSSDPGFAPLRRPQTQFADWTPKDLSPHDENVEVYSNCESVELTLNGKSLGAKPMNGDASPRKWTVPFESGVLKAIASNKSKGVATDELHTAGKPAKIVLTTDQESITPTWDDFAQLTVTVVDENGTLVPSAADAITFALEGPGVIAAVDNADNSSHEPFRGNTRRAYQGRCVAMIKSTAARGVIHVSASAPGLAGSEVILKAAAAAAAAARASRD
jgi:beta-galactosidase